MSTAHRCVESCLRDCPACGHEVDHTAAFHAPGCAATLDAARSTPDAAAEWNSEPDGDWGVRAAAETPVAGEAEHRAEVREMLAEADAQDVGPDGIADALMDMADRWARAATPSPDGLEALRRKIEALPGVDIEVSRVAVPLERFRDALTLDPAKTKVFYSDVGGMIDRAAVLRALDEAASQDAGEGGT